LIARANTETPHSSSAKPVRDTILASYTRDFMDQDLLDFALARELLRSAQSVALVIFRAA